MILDEIKSKLEAKIPGVALKKVRESLLIENPVELIQVAAVIHKSAEFGFDYLSSVTASDYLTYLETVYHFYSITKKEGPLVLRVRVSKENPHIPSLFKLFRSAEFQEREAYDLYGIIYDGHPDLRRLLMWEGFDGFPMRKDFAQEDSESLGEEDLTWLQNHEVKVTEDMWKEARTPPQVQKPKSGE